MISRLNQHPFAVKAHLDYSLSLTYALPLSDLQALLPPCLTPDSWESKWGFAAIAMVKTSALRPAGFPAWAGQRFFLIGYRIFVRYRNAAGKNLRGLFILKSATDSAAMKTLGALFTKYAYDRIDIRAEEKANILRVSSAADRLDVSADIGTDEPLLPASSPFRDWKAARRFAGPLPFTFSYDAGAKEVLIVEGRREDWVPKPVELLDQSAGMLHCLGLAAAVPASAFLVRDIPYHWKKGVIEKWNG